MYCSQTSMKSGDDFTNSIELMTSFLNGEEYCILVLSIATHETRVMQFDN